MTKVANEFFKKTKKDREMRFGFLDSANEDGSFPEIIKREYQSHLGRIFKFYEEEPIGPLKDDNQSEQAGPSGIQKKNKFGVDMFVPEPPSTYKFNLKYFRTHLQNNERQHVLKRLFFILNNGYNWRLIRRLDPLSEGKKVFLNLSAEQQPKVAEHGAFFFESRDLKLQKK